MSILLMQKKELHKIKLLNKINSKNAWKIIKNIKDFGKNSKLTAQKKVKDNLIIQYFIDKISGDKKNKNLLDYKMQ